MDPAHLPALVAFANVARHQSFTRAAAEGGVSASALSQTIRALEAQLNVRLFNRTTRRVSLTEAGSQLLARVRPALAMLEAAYETLDEARAEPMGTLRINLPRVASDLLVMPHLAEFEQRYPRVIVELILDDGLTDLIGEGFDAGIRLGEQLARDMVAVPLTGPLRVVVAGSPAYFARNPKPATLDDLARHNCLRYRFSTSRGLYRWEFAGRSEAQRVLEVETSGTFVTNDLRTMVQAAEQGVGLLHVIEDFIEPQLGDGRLVRVLDEFAMTFDGFSLYMPSRLQLPLKMRVFVDFLKEKCEARKAGKR